MSGVKGISKNWKLIGEVIGAGNLYRTSETTWEVVNVEYARRISGKFDGRVFDKAALKAEFEFLGVADFGASGCVKRWRQRAAIDELQAMAQAQGEYA